ncbi:Adenylate kinase [uncultured archaeon]|nr:Adenylate kinase [uncultured archaeon]
MNLILLGPPGTGKGTIAEFIRQRFGFAHISTGDLLREEVANVTPIGKKIAEIMASGRLVDDAVVLSVLEGKIASMNGKPFVLDGYPRNLGQAKMLEELLERLRVKMDLALEIDSSEEVIVKRLSSRRQCSKCRRIYGLDVPSMVQGICDDCGAPTFLRDDDKPEVVKKRLLVYSEATRPLIDFYSGKKILKKINGNRTLQEIFSDVEGLLSGFQKSQPEKSDRD